MAASKTMKSERVRDAFLIRSLREPERIRALLRPHRRYAAYGLAQLEPPLFEQSQWWLAEDGPEKALLMHSHGGLGQALLALGDEIALYALLSIHPGPVYSFATAELGHAGVLRQFFSLGQKQPMQRMVVDSRSFVEPSAADVPKAELRRLTARDTRAVNQLNRSEAEGISYRRSQIGEGIYFGAILEDRLVAMAGTHAVAAQERIAVLGNVFTHPDYRNSHLALLATSAVTRELLETCDEVVLSVNPRNEPAVNAYRRLGYRHDSDLIETAVTRSESIGVTSLARRLLARWRGRESGGELVYSPARHG